LILNKNFLQLKKNYRKKDIFLANFSILILLNLLNNVFGLNKYQINNKDINEKFLNDLYKIIISKIEERKQKNYQRNIFKQNLKLKKIKEMEEKNNLKDFEILELNL